MAAAREVEEHECGEVGSEYMDDIMCQPCHEDKNIREAVGMCVECQDYLCQSCYDVHKTPKPMRKHELISKEQMLNSQVSMARKDKCTEMCNQHGEKTIKYYCKNHCQLVCGVCINLHHRACDGVIYIPHVAKDLENNEDFKQAEGQLKSTVEKAEYMLVKITQTSGVFYEDCSQAEKTVHRLRKDINNALDKIKAGLVETIGTKKSEMSDRVTKVTENISSIQKHLQQISTITNSLQHKGEKCDLFSSLMKSKDILQALSDGLKQIEIGQTEQIPRVKFLSNREVLKSLKDPDLLGRLVETEIDTLVRAEHMNDIHVKTRSDTTECSITGSVVLPDNNLLLTDSNNNCIKYVDTYNNRVIKELGLTSSPRDITLISNSQAAVTLPDEEQIAFVETQSTTMTVQRTVDVNEACYGLDYRKGKLSVTIPSSNTIQVLNLQGVLLHTIKNKRGQHLFDRPFYVKFGQDSSTLYVSNLLPYDYLICRGAVKPNSINQSNLSRYNVVCVKVDGTVIGKYADNRLSFARGILTDKSGNVYVCGQNSRNVHQITPYCRHIRILLSESDGSKRPCSISFNGAENKLYIGLWECNMVKMYKCFLETQ